MRVVSMPNFKLNSIFDPQMTVISVKCGDVIKQNHIFGPFIDVAHKKNYTIEFLRSNWIRKLRFSFKILNFENWPFFTLFDLTFKSNLKLSFPLDSTSKITI